MSKVSKHHALAFLLALTAALALVAQAPALARAETRLRLATTTSTENTGLLQVLLPPFEAQAGVKVDVIAVGTGKALELGRRCDVDVLMVHAPDLEEKYVAEGYGVDRRALMHNRFVLVGPASDPAGVAKAPGLPQAMAALAQVKAGFVSRGDNSGTHIKELELWKLAGIQPSWPGYKEAGQGMGAVLTMAAQLGAYTLTDTGTYYKYKSKGQLNLEVLRQGDEPLKNPYHVMLVNAGKCPQAQTALGKQFLDYLVSPQAQAIIAGFKADGQQLFWPDAQPKP